MMKPPQMILAHFLALIFAGQVHLHSVNIHPERATGIVGGEVQINCDVEFGPNNEMNWDFNNAIVYIIAGGGENYPRGASKYSVQRTGMNFALTVKDLKLKDGGEYRCTSFTSEATAFLVVLDTPSITLHPLASLEGEKVMVTCEALFGGPRKDLILPDHFPNLKLHLNGSSPKEMLTEKTTNNNKEHCFTISMTQNLTVLASSNNRQITCEMGTAEPSMKSSGVAVINVLYSVRDIHIAPNKEKYTVGDNISCIADSNPAPDYEWKEVQGASTIDGKWLKITESMIGENKWECVARNMIHEEMFEERLQGSFLVVDPRINGNGSSAVTIRVVVVVIIILVIIATFFIRKKLKKPKGSRTNGNANNLQETAPPETETLLDGKTKAPNLGYLECILKSVENKQDLDQHGKEILRVLKEDRKSILENDPNILMVLIKKADKLIDSEYYEDIIKVALNGGEDSPLKSLLDILKSDEGRFKLIMKNQNKLFSVIKIISSHGDVQCRTQCLNYIIVTRTFSGIRYTFEWSEEYLSTVKELLENGADPTWIHPEDLERERKDRSTAQNELFFDIFVNLWEKNDLHESLLQVLPLMLSWKCKDNWRLRGNLLHRFVLPQWDYIATNRESMPPDFFRQFKNILREILIHDGTLLVERDYPWGNTPLQLFLDGIELEESIFGEVREIFQMLQTPQVLSSQDDQGLNALHDLAFYFPVIQGEVTQSGRESFLDLVKSFVNESTVGCQDINGQTALHILAWKFPGEILEQWREVYQDFVKHLATYNILEIKDIVDYTALHRLADRFTFEIEDWRMETFVEVLKCLAVPRTICIKNENGKTALEIITRKRRNKVPEHYKDKFKEISDILSGNN